ncbi:MAG: flotillin family protein [Paludibacteraceae bacterium]|nr:flotillin family protein [Paludibacteraceae bacterium]
MIGDSNVGMMVAILVIVAIFSVIAILTRYRKCKPDQIMVIYGRTGSKEKSAKLIHGGGSFVWPIVQGVDYLSLRPFQVDCFLKGAISAQNIRVNVPTIITVAISTDAAVMQNAAERLLGRPHSEIEADVKDLAYGQMRGIISDMKIEELNNDRDKFVEQIRKNLGTELNKLGLDIINVNIADIVDEANYIVNLGKESSSRAQNQAEANIEEQRKLGQIKIAEQTRERETKIAEQIREKETQIAEIDKDRAIKVAEANRIKEASVAEARAQQESAIAESQSKKDINIAEADKRAKVGRNEANKAVANSNAELRVIQAEADRISGEAEVKSNADIQIQKELKNQQIEESRAKRVETQLRADRIVPAEMNKQETILNAQAQSEKLIIQAEAEAEAKLRVAKAEAEAIRLKALAEAEGKQKALEAEAEGFRKMMEAADKNPEIAVKYKFINECKEIAGVQVKAFEHMNFGNVQVWDSGNGTTSRFMESIIKTAAPALNIMKEMNIPMLSDKLKGDETDSEPKDL